MPVVEAEQAVEQFRASLDPAAAWGVPAHVTVLYPFLPPDRIDDEVLTTLRQTFAAIPRFDVTFTHVDWFGDSVVWLAPRPDSGFRDLTAAVCRRYPEAPPYEGEHIEVVPHLTIGQDAAAEVMSNAAEAVSAHLPLHAAVDVVRLIAGAPAPNAWHTLCEFRLGRS
ncbi:2'-5' RNA ligase family protein [Micromonospora yasonensis]|uniref:2'-5' RNA ligase family protein n=1 Tax=Micromonospora yasonensis TaxID=1128667 RepID=UPI00222EA735|nr:2'-5' RNA ligase family protein [Micromonospora yasonensis]MCW3839116.1 2'-5' RNA ligase family protein [Micromonospora yasonensis]